MNKLKQALLLVIFSSACAVQKNVTQPTYTLSGTIAGAEDGSWVYLVNIDRFNIAPLSDSAQLRKGRFTFSGTVPHDVMLALVGLKGPIYAADGRTVQEYRIRDGALIWLENSAIEFRGTKGALLKAEVSGVLSQDDFATFTGSSNAPRYIRQNPDAYFSAYLLDVYKESWGRGEVSQLYSLLGYKAQKSLFGRQVAEFLALPGQ